MKFPLLACLLISAIFLGGCETVVETHEPVRYGRVYDRPDYDRDRYHYRDHDRPREYYYRDGRRYERDVVVNDRVVVVQQPRIAPRLGPRIIVPTPRYSDRDRDRNDHDRYDNRGSHNRNDHDRDKGKDKGKSKNKKKDKDKDDDDRNGHR